MMLADSDEPWLIAASEGVIVLISFGGWKTAIAKNKKKNRNDYYCHYGGVQQRELTRLCLTVNPGLCFGHL